VVGVESSGGLERNWVRFFRNLGPNFTIHVLNGLAVKCFLSRNLHRSTTDAISAKGIANYLCSGMRPGDLRPAPAPSGDLVLYRTHCQTRRMVAKMKNQLQCILPSIHPGLVQFCREGIPQWVLLLLQRYPTAAHLARARAKTVAKIPYITPQRAQELIDDAKVSTAALDDASAAEAAKYLTGLITMVEPQVEAVKEKLLKSLRDQPDFAILTSIPGIGEVTAVTLMMEVGNFDRFHSANALVAFAGLDSSIEQSGDGIRYKSISKRGRSEIRAMLYMAAKSAYRCNPVIAEFYQRLTTQHDPRKLAKTHNQALVACMAKLLRIAYACVLSQKHFDPDHLAKLRECARSTEVDQEASTQSSPEVQPVLEVQAVLVVQASPEVQPRGVTTQNRTSCPRKRNPSPHASSLNAPVSGRESRRRRRSLAELQAQ
jgi:transposase